MVIEQNTHAEGDNFELLKTHSCPWHFFCQTSPPSTVACFVDWENVRKLLHDKKTRKSLFDYNNPELLMSFFNSFLEPAERFYRIFIYSSAPIDHVQYNRKKYDLTNTPAYKMASSFIHKMSLENIVAMRLGKLKIRDIKPPIGTAPPKFTPSQKQVDMLLGLDIAHVSHNKLADKVLLFSYDNDIVPALKTARINGLQVITAKFSPWRKLGDDLKKHSDFMRAVSLKELMPRLKALTKN